MLWGGTEPLIVHASGETEVIPSSDDSYCNNGGGAKVFMNCTLQDVINAITSGKSVFGVNGLGAYLSLAMVSENAVGFGMQDSNMWLEFDAPNTPLYYVNCPVV